MQDKKNSQRLSAALWIIFAFLVWVFTFRGYLFSRYSLISDAKSYYDHTKFFIENLGHGIYPLWDPYWFYGAPNDFFLRRIGAFNPFYLSILVFKSFGVPYTLSYLWFLGSYYFSGMAAFYLLAMRIYQDRLMAYSGYLILLFSALGTRLFDSYMMLVTVPLIWFFYFLVAFTQTPRKHFFLGMVLSAMVLAGTYIPFYFLIIVAVFLLLFILLYFKEIPGMIKRYRLFFDHNKIIVFLSLFVLAFSLIPLVTFFHNSSHGQVVLPLRHGNAGSQNTLIVPQQTLDWGLAEDFMYSFYFSDLRLFKFAVVYVPFFAVIVLLLGLMGRMNRRAALMFLSGTLLVCCMLPHGLPFYDYLYRHFIILKYFRNLHFFIWFFLIPLFVLLAMEHWKMFSEIKASDHRSRRALIAYVWLVHLAVLAFVVWRNDAVWGTYIMIVSSLAFWTLTALRRIRSDFGGFLLLTFTVLVQPLEAYHFFMLKADPYPGSYAYDFSFSTIKINDPGLIKPENIPKDKGALYFASAGYNFIYQNISNYSLAKYLRNKLMLVDHLQSVDREQAPALIEHGFQTDDNSAVIFKGSVPDPGLNGDDPHPPAKLLRLDKNSPGFKLLSFDADHLSIRLDVPYKKFLIYNDCYDPYWQVRINGHHASLYEVNGAFKGVWVPAGGNLIEFTYGLWWQYAINILLSFFAFILLIGVVLYARVP